MYKVMLRRLRVTIVVIKNNDTFPLYRIFVGLHVAVNNIKVFNVATEMQHYILCALLSK